MSFFLHIFLMAAAVSCIMTGVSVAMFFRRKKYWLKLHKSVNSLGILLMTAGIIMAFIYVSGTGNNHFNEPHHITGLISYLSVVVTSLLGFYQFKAKNKSAVRMAHRWLGRVSLMMSLLTIVLGLMMINVI
jgi:hypothetical protein